MRIEIDDVSSICLAHKIFNYLKETVIMETCGIPDGMILERIGEIIKDDVNICLDEFNNKDVII